MHQTNISEDRAFVEGTCPVQFGNLYYRIYQGPQESAPLLVVHGGPGYPGDYLFPLSELALERTVIFYDQLGCGRSTSQVSDEALTLRQFAVDLEVLLNHLRLQEFDLLGHSFGGVLVLAHQGEAANAKARKIVLSSPLISTQDWLEDAEALVDELPAAERLAIRDLNSEGYKNAEDLFYQRHFCNLTPWPAPLMATVETHSQHVYEYMWGPNEFTQSGNLSAAAEASTLGRLNVPILLICGRQDEARPERLAQYRTLCSNAELHVIEDATHSAHLEKPAEYLSVVTRFLGGSEMR